MNDEFKDILLKIAATPPVAPPENFTENVMRSVFRERPGVVERLREILLRPRGRLFAPRGLLSAASTRRECAFYYILTGIFYGVMGLVLMVGLEGGAGEAALAHWTRIQPQLMIAAALWLSGLGMVLLLNDRMEIEVAKTGTLLYLLFVVLSGSAVVMAYRIPVLMASTGIFVISGVVMGILLHQNISIYQKSRHH
jgi:hypothetical protein